MTNQTDNKCLGIFGFLFGHKFIKSKGGYVYRSYSCWRCGRMRNISENEL